MKRPGVTTALLLVLAAIPALVALVRLYQIPSGTLPNESLHFLPGPVSHFLHALTGASFALLAPLQFHPGLRRRLPDPAPPPWPGPCRGRHRPCRPAASIWSPFTPRPQP